jgi:hypothetical protein
MSLILNLCFLECHFFQAQENTIPNMKRICNIFEPTANIICFPVTCLLDVMQIELVNMDLYAGRREVEHFDKKLKTKKPQCALELGSFCVNKWGPSFLREKCQLKLQVERNLDAPLNHDGKNMKSCIRVTGALVTHSSLTPHCRFGLNNTGF